MIHIVFEEANVAVLQKVFELDEQMQGDIIEIKDDYAVGPIANIYEPEGYQQRRDWCKALLENTPYTDQLELVDDKLAVHHLLKSWMKNQMKKYGYGWHKTNMMFAATIGS